MVSGLLARGHWLTGEDQVMLSPEKKEILILSAYPEVNRVLGTIFLSITLSQPRSMWSRCMFPWCVYTLKLIKPRRFHVLQIFLYLSCLSSFTHQQPGHLLLCAVFFCLVFFKHLIHVSESGISFASSLSAHIATWNSLSCWSGPHCGVNEQNWPLEPFLHPDKGPLQKTIIFKAPV